jgi:agmatinase
MTKSTTTPKEKLVNFFGLPERYSTHERSQVVIIPVPYEATTSYGKGTKNGPKAVMAASQEVELFDDELWLEPYKIGIQTAPEVTMTAATKTTKQPFKDLYKTVLPLVEFGKFPIIIGGERSLSLGGVQACIERYPNLSVLQISAHSDLRESYQGNPYSHASVSHQLYHTLPEPILTQVGVRNISAEAAAWLETEKPTINIFWARKQNRWDLREIVQTLSKNVYLTIDVSALDPSIMPSTGTPEPGGLSWQQLTDLVKMVCIRKNVVAADIVELAPIKGLHAPDFLVAKLLYKLIGYRFALDLGVTKKYL